MPFFRSVIFVSSLSMQVTSIPKSARQAPVTRPTYPVPTMQMFMRLLRMGAAARGAQPAESSVPGAGLSSAGSSAVDRAAEEPEELPPGDLPRLAGAFGRRRGRARGGGGGHDPGRRGLGRAEAGRDDRLEGFLEARPREEA